jgi:serine/threonine-protein kinase
MEYLEGESLSEALRRADRPFSALLYLLLPALRAVAAAHKQGVIHRDIKPDNIFLSRHEQLIEAKVLDFGISKVEARDAQALSLTRTGTAMGTPNYMSYEQLLGEKQIDGRTDIYAFGVILYEILTGRLPFEAETFSALIVKVATTEPLPPVQLRADIPLALQNIVQWAMAKDRAQRCPSMEALIAALEPFADGNSAPVYSTLSGSRADPSASHVSAPHAAQAQNPAAAASTLASTRTRTRAPMLVLIVGAALLALCAGIFLLLDRNAPQATRKPPPFTVPTPGVAPRARPTQVAAEKPHGRTAAPASHLPMPAVHTQRAIGASAASQHHTQRPSAEAAATPSPTPAAAASELPSKHNELAPKPADSDRYVTPDGRRVVRAPTPGAASSSDTPHAPYTTSSGRLVIPAP